MTIRSQRSSPAAASAAGTHRVLRVVAPSPADRLEPWALPPPAPREPVPASTGDTRVRRVVLARTRRAAADPVGLVARLLEAAGVVRCVEADGAVLAGGDRRALARLLGEGDALVVDSLGAAPVLPPLLQVSVRMVAAFGSSVTALRPRRSDLPLVAPLETHARAWERAAEVAFALAEMEGREEVWCAVREPGWPLLASDRALRFRRAALQRVGVTGRRLSLADARRRLLFPAGAGPDVLLADAGELDGLVRAAAGGVGWSNAVPGLHVGDGVALAEVACGGGRRPVAATGQLAFSAARLAARLLRQLRQHPAARRLDDALAAELAAIARGPLDPWIELASEPAVRLTGALLDRLAAPAPPEEVTR